MKDRLAFVLSNPHTRIPVIVVLVCVLACKVGAIWLPQFSQQFKESADTIVKCALAWAAWFSGGAPAQPASSDKPSTDKPTQ